MKPNHERCMMRSLLLAATVHDLNPGRGSRGSRVRRLFVLTIDEMPDLPQSRSPETADGEGSSAEVFPRRGCEVNQNPGPDAVLPTGNSPRRYATGRSEKAGVGASSAAHSKPRLPSRQRALQHLF